MNLREFAIDCMNGLMVIVAAVGAITAFMVGTWGIMKLGKMLALNLIR